MILNQINLLFFQSGVYGHVVAKRCFSNVCARGNLPGRREFTRLNSTRRVGPSRGERKRISPWAIYLSTKASLSPFGMARKKQGACLCLLLDQKRLFSTASKRKSILGEKNLAGLCGGWRHRFAHESDVKSPLHRHRISSEDAEQLSRGHQG